MHAFVHAYTITIITIKTIKNCSTRKCTKRHKYVSKSSGERAYSVLPVPKVGACPSVHPIDAHAWNRSWMSSSTVPQADPASPLLGPRYKYGHLPACGSDPGLRDGTMQETPTIRSRQAL